ncbi:uncharacterized protein B0I36DRAFT_340338 [Microdochium trichocladiopsis]|uniref:Uncharacterized protein n=1 Tax=Microdochium trichocladiopsis TaxID=1682393 RepID=A0A9P9BFW9_9PEZI|nr:uncharacterized protein B0I36DRAFT_340338 [Microdochium trichocladiopsis]KAH7012756.1 hypothetical protein B0I36DRAFT_340338 [Microdochium trichocladiopsis]
MHVANSLPSDATRAPANSMPEIICLADSDDEVIYLRTCTKQPRWDPGARRDISRKLSKEPTRRPPPSKDARRHRNTDVFLAPKRSTRCPRSRANPKATARCGNCRRRAEATATHSIPAEIIGKLVKLGYQRNVQRQQSQPPVYGCFDKSGSFCRRLYYSQNTMDRAGSAPISHDQVEYNARFQGMTRQQVRATACHYLKESMALFWLKARYDLDGLRAAEHTRRRWKLLKPKTRVEI